MFFANESRLFHDALRACMAEGRMPSQREVEQVAAKIWNDSYRALAKVEWSDVPIGSIEEQRTLSAARTALGMPTAFWAELGEAA